MRYFYIPLFFLILSCGTTKKDYVCGDHLCKNKKDFNEYFSQNLIVEIKSKNNKKFKKNKNIDLVKLNSKSLSEKKKESVKSKKNNQIILKEENKKLKIKKKILLREEKNRKIVEKNIQKEEKKISKLSKSKVLDKKKKIGEIKHTKEKLEDISDKIPPTEKNNVVNVLSKKNSINSINAKKSKSLCDGIKDCNIETIAELLIKKGKDKPYPDISSN